MTSCHATPPPPNTMLQGCNILFVRRGGPSCGAGEATLFWGVGSCVGHATLCGDSFVLGGCNILFGHRLCAGVLHGKQKEQRRQICRRVHALSANGTRAARAFPASIVAGVGRKSTELSRETQELPLGSVELLLIEKALLVGLGTSSAAPQHAALFTDRPCLETVWKPCAIRCNLQHGSWKP